MVGIYKITSPSGKVYIGQSWDIKNRWNKYRKSLCKNQRYLFNSLSKYGFDSHLFEIIHILPADISQKVLDDYEIFYWELYKNCGCKMLNIKEPGRGGKNSEETKNLMRKNNWNAKNKGSLSPSWGIKHSKEHIEKCASKRRGILHHMYGKFGKNHQRFGIPQPDSFKEKCRRKVINTTTQEIYDSVSMAEVAVGLKPASLRYHLKKKTNNIYNLCYLDEYNKNP